MNYLLVIIYSVFCGMYVVRAVFIPARKPQLAPVPDPVEIEARRLAEIEINEFCAQWDDLFGLTPAKPKVMVDGPEVTPQQRRDFLDGLPPGVASVQRDGCSYAPIVLRGKPKDVHRVTWTGESFCLGCNRWLKGDDEYHVHQYNMMGECVI